MSQSQPVLEALLVDETALIKTSAELLHNLLGHRTIDGFARVAIEDEAVRDENVDPDEEDDVFLIRIDGAWHAIWTDTTAIFCVREGDLAWSLVPAAADCAAICTDSTSRCALLECSIVSDPTGEEPPAGQEKGRVTRFVELGTGRVLLEIGLEWYSYQYRPCHPMGLTSPSGRRVCPGETVIVVGHPVDGSFDVRRLLISNGPADWAIEDILVGGVSRLTAGHGDIPGEVFAPTALDGLLIGSIDPDRPLAVRARYVGLDPAGCEFFCVAWLESPTVTQLSQGIIVGGAWIFSSPVSVPCTREPQHDDV